MRATGVSRCFGSMLLANASKSARRAIAFGAQRAAHPRHERVPGVRLRRRICEIETVHRATPALEVAAAIERLAAHDSGHREKSVADTVVVEIAEIGFE